MNRHAAGQPTGGQFASSAASTSTGVDLDAEEAPSADRQAVADAYRSRVEAMLYGEDPMLVRGFADDVAERAADGDLPDDPELADLDNEWHIYGEPPDPSDWD